jgi:zinc protease
VRIEHEKVSTDWLIAAARAPGIHHPDVPALHLLAVLLSGGQSSPLHRRLVLGGLATHVSASLLDVDWVMASPGLFLIEAAMQHGVPAEAAEDAIDEVLAGFRNRGVPSEEFERALNQLRLSHYSALRANMALARYLGGFAVTCGDPLFGERLTQAVERTTPGQIADVLERYLIAAPRVVVVQSPKAERP